MKRSLIAILISLATVAALPAALHVYQVPDLAGGNEKPSIARNAQGDMLIVYRNNVSGAAFYFQRHDGGTLGPEIIAGQSYEQFAKENIFVTDIVADPAGNFHAIWNFDIHKGAWGMYYAVFDIATERWNTPTRIVSGKVEGPRLTINPLTNDLVLVYDCYLPGNKDVFLKIKTHAGWQKEIDISRDTQVEARPSGLSAARAALTARAADDQTGISAPHGALAETNAWVSVDPSDGYVYITWKADKWNETYSRWELQIVVALYDPSYKRVWLGRVTHDYEGFHVLPTIDVINGKSMMAHAWQQEAGYYYINFVRSGNSLIYDPAVLYAHRIATCPLVPHWEFFGYVVAHGDQMMFVYKDPAKQTNLLRFTPDGKRLDKSPIDLCNDEPSLWPIDVFSAPEVGLLTVWATPREGDASIHYSVYDIPKFNLTISATSGGTTTPPPATYYKEPGSLVTVRAVPAQNYRFISWTGDASGSTNPITLRIDKSLRIQANFFRIQSVANLRVEKRIERSFFNGYTLNALTWEANPQNAERGLTVASHRVYRKARTEDNTKWTRIAADLAGAVLRYEDLRVSKDSDYVYAVTCVDDMGNESTVY